MLNVVLDFVYTYCIYHKTTLVARVHMHYAGAEKHVNCNYANYFKDL